MLTFRPATLDDADLLLAWRNDPLTRTMSRTSDVVARSNHVGWLQKRLSSETPDLFICEDSGVPVGTFRVDGDEISYTISPQHRGKGFATAMLLLAHASFGAKQAHIFPRNKASIAAAKSAGHIVKMIDQT